MHHIEGRVIYLRPAHGNTGTAFEIPVACQSVGRVLEIENHLHPFYMLQKSNTIRTLKSYIFSGET